MRSLGFLGILVVAVGRTDQVRQVGLVVLYILAIRPMLTFIPILVALITPRFTTRRCKVVLPLISRIRIKTDAGGC